MGEGRLLRDDELAVYRLKVREPLYDGWVPVMLAEELLGHIAALEARLAAAERVVEAARHSLATLHGVTASDGLGAYSEAMDDGCDPNGAWDVFCSETWVIDESTVLAAIDTYAAAKEGA